MALHLILLSLLFWDPLWADFLNGTHCTHRTSSDFPEDNESRAVEETLNVESGDSGFSIEQTKNGTRVCQDSTAFPTFSQIS